MSDNVQELHRHIRLLEDRLLDDDVISGELQKLTARIDSLDRSYELLDKLDQILRNVAKPAPQMPIFFTCIDKLVELSLPQSMFALIVKTIAPALIGEVDGTKPSAAPVERTSQAGEGAAHDVIVAPAKPRNKPGPKRGSKRRKLKAKRGRGPSALNPDEPRTGTGKGEQWRKDAALKAAQTKAARKLAGNGATPPQLRA